MKALKYISLVGAVALFACEQAQPTAAPPANTPPIVPPSPVVIPADPAPTPAQPPHYDPVGVGMEGGHEVGLMPAPVEPEAHIRSRRRMDVDQLDAALRQVSGGLGWEVNGRNQLDALESTLGKPDYINTTTEDLETSAMFQKFLDDASRNVCTRLMDREVRAAPGDRVFLVHARPTDTWAAEQARIEQNIVELLLRFHGRSAASLGAEVSRWQWLYQSAEHISGDPMQAWNTVCVGLINHPDFYTY
jgi:hypothetical protein